jgi:hypothetical protein
VDPRERWRTLQAHLNDARIRLDAGDRAGALKEIEAALALDPDFLAAQTLRDRIVAAGPSQTAGQKLASDSQFGQPGGSAPLVSRDPLAAFEARARQRRVERRLTAASAALARRDVEAARAAVREVEDLSPTHSALAGLQAELAAAERPRPWRPHLGPAAAAAATFAALVLGASWIEDTTGLLSYPLAQVVELVAPTPASPMTDALIEDIDRVGTAGDGLPTDVRVDATRSAPDPRLAVLTTTVAASVAAPEESRPIPAPALVLTAPPILPPGPLSDPIAPAPPRQPIPAAANLAGAGITGPVIDEERLVHATLQRYRAAYDELDARSAQAVWPEVDGSALARAFDNLASQRLTFDSCNVEVAGVAAKAVCRGSARYVPKVGSREPRIEPRVWNFTLVKAGEDWQIESARAAR